MRRQSVVASPAPSSSAVGSSRSSSADISSQFRTASGVLVACHQLSYLRAKHKRGSAVDTPRTITSFWEAESMPIDTQLSSLASPCIDCTAHCDSKDCQLLQTSTESCSDQCIIVSCDDPSSACFDSCLDSCLDEPCYMESCNGGVDCNFEEFLQCCTDPHGYFGNYDLDLAASQLGPTGGFADAWHAQTSLQSNPAGQRFPAPQEISLQPSLSYSSSGSSSASHDASQFHPYQRVFNPQQQRMNNFSTQMDSQPQRGIQAGNNVPFTCLWSNCGAAFNSLSDLVGHVNLMHLHPSSPRTTQRRQGVSSPNGNEISCQWGNCQTFPSPTAVPGPSSGMQPEIALSMLSSHLMQDHLGLLSPSQVRGARPMHPVSQPLFGNYGQFHGNMPFQVQPQPPHQYSLQNSSGGSSNSTNIPTPSSSSSPTPEPPQREHDCSTSTHVCHWTRCGRSFASCDELTAHITSEHVGSGKSHYHCYWAGCDRHGDKGFASKQKILRHLQSHTGHRPFQCQICQQNFSEAATLQQHMRRHTQEKPFVCDFPGCGKAFAITGALTIHKRTHNGERPFKCPHCDKAFAESSNLSKHLRTHTGDRPYRCPEPGCDKCFARPDQLQRHANVHNKKRA